MVLKTLLPLPDLKQNPTVLVVVQENNELVSLPVSWALLNSPDNRISYTITLRDDSGKEVQKEEANSDATQLLFTDIGSDGLYTVCAVATATTEGATSSEVCSDVVKVESRDVGKNLLIHGTKGN